MHPHSVYTSDPYVCISQHRSGGNDVSSSGSFVTRLVRYRDIDRLSPIHLSLDSPAFLVRRHAVLLLLDPLRAVIMADRFILVVPDGADNILAIMNAYIAVGQEHQPEKLSVSLTVSPVLIRDGRRESERSTSTTTGTATGTCPSST